MKKSLQILILGRWLSLNDSGYLIQRMSKKKLNNIRCQITSTIIEYICFVSEVKIENLSNKFLKIEAMATVDKIRNSLIDKIISIRDKEILEAIDKLVSLSASDIVELTNEQKKMLQMSEDDIENGQLISQDQMNKHNLEWLNEM